MPTIFDIIGKTHVEAGLMFALMISVSHLSGILDIGPLKRSWLMRDPMRIFSAATVLGVLSWLSFEYSLGKLV